MSSGESAATAGNGRPARRLAVLSCMDARLDPYAILGLEPGDAHVIRNAGGLATDDAIRSLALSQHLLGTDTVILIQHTDCGMSKITDEDFAVQMEQATGRRPEWTAGAFSDLEMSVRESLRRLEQSPFLRHGSARGFIYEVETGELREVNSP